jgi:hypothetical protein
MSDPKAISSHIQKRLAAAKRDGVGAVEASEWLIEAHLIEKDKQPHARLRSLLREGKIKGAYQFPNKRWVIVNGSRFPDGIQRIIPSREAAKALKLSEKSLHQFMTDGDLNALDFGPTPALFLEDELQRFRQDVIDPSYELDLPKLVRKKKTDVDKLKRQLYYLRSDIRLIGERIDELIRLLE